MESINSRPCVPGLAEALFIFAYGISITGAENIIALGAESTFAPTTIFLRPWRRYTSHFTIM